MKTSPRVSYTEKWAAERVTQRPSGVKALAIEINVTLLQLSQRNDGDIALAAENVLQGMANLPKDSIELMVEAGWITRSGQGDWEYQSQAASSAVRNS